jgi:KDO2-lipid IV(A) lauroyltransferase
MGKALALPYTNGWDAKSKKYRICIYPSLENFPSESIEEDAIRINQFIETQVRANPEQYLWSHRRFKTRPDGQKDFYHVETERYRRKRDKQKTMSKK